HRRVQLHHGGGIVQEAAGDQARQRLDARAGDLALAHHDRGAADHLAGGAHPTRVHRGVRAGDHHDRVLTVLGDLTIARPVGPSTSLTCERSTPAAWRPDSPTEAWASVPIAPTIATVPPSRAAATA